MTEENERKLKNYMEEVVDRKLKELLQDRNDVCQCKHCRLDIMAIALNDLPPRYIVSEKGEVYSKVSSLMVQFSTDVTRALVEAIEMVKENPRH